MPPAAVDAVVAEFAVNYARWSIGRRGKILVPVESGPTLRGTRVR